MDTQVIEQSVKKVPLGDGIFQVEHPTKGTQYEVRVSRRVNGKRVNKQMTVKNLARAKLARRDLIETLGDEIRNGAHDPSVTFAEFLPKFLEEIKKKWSPSTHYRRTSTFRANFLQKFGPMPLKAITSQVVNAHFEEIAKGKRYGSVRELVKCIKALFESARRKGLVARAPR